MDVSQFCCCLLASRVHSSEHAKGLEEVGRPSALGVQSEAVSLVPRPYEEGRVAFDLLREVRMLSYRVDDNRILLTLLLEKIRSGDLRQAEHVCKVGVLVARELCNVPLCNVCEGKLPLHLLEVLRPLAFSGFLDVLAADLLFSCSDPLDLLARPFVAPASAHKVEELSHFQLLEPPQLQIFCLLVRFLEVEDLSDQRQPLAEHLCLRYVALPEVGRVEIKTGAESHGVDDHLEHANRFQGIAYVIVSLQ